MKITLKNKELSPAINLLQEMDLVGRQSRCRSKLVKLLMSAFEEFLKDEKELLSTNHLLAADEAVLNEQDRERQDVINYNKEQAVLLEEEVVIDAGLYEKYIDEIPQIFEDYDDKLSGEQAAIYDRLMDEFEKEVAE